MKRRTYNLIYLVRRVLTLREQNAARGDSRARGFKAPISLIALNPGHGQRFYKNKQTDRGSTGVGSPD